MDQITQHPSFLQVSGLMHRFQLLQYLNLTHRRDKKVATAHYIVSIFETFFCAALRINTVDENFINLMIITYIVLTRKCNKSKLTYLSSINQQIFLRRTAKITVEI